MIAMTDEVSRRPGGKLVEGSFPRAIEPDSWKALFADLANGHATAVGALYDACSRQVFGLALWRTQSVEDASDVVQELFVKVVGGPTDLTRVANPRSWLLSLAYRLSIDVLRRKKRRPTSSLEDCPLLVAVDEDPARAIDAANASRLLARLPPPQRDAIYLRHFADCTFQTIGHILHVPTFTAASRYRLGMRTFRKLMGEKNEQ
jgi:RNA polymerase sigma-70 factor (ECF subfamily)